MRPARAFNPLLAVVVLLGLTAVGPASADEGQWPPDQLVQLDWNALAQRGLALKPEEIWGPNGTGLAQAIVNLEGCSAGFVSPEGLVASNHHCVYGAIQQHSTSERDYLRDGFVAATRADELPAKGQRVLVLRRIEDVTSKLRPTIAHGGDDVARQLAIERLQKALVAACERKPATRCRVASYHGGLRYVLFESLEIRDVRLVYAPPAAVGDFGGEADNWRWPRHTGDFGLVRAYVAPDGSSADYAPGNVPYRPARHLELSREGVGEGDLVMILGYPGRTDRYGTAASVRHDLERFYPWRLDAYRGLQRVLEQVAAKDGEAAVRVADATKSVINRATNADAMIAGLRRNDVLAQRRDREAALAAWIGKDPARVRKYGTLVADLDAVLAAGAATFERDAELALLPAASRPLSAALTLLRWSRERSRTDLEREPGYQDRDRTRVKAALEKMQKDLHPLADRATLAYALRRALALPEGQRIPAIDAALAGREVEAFVDDALARTRLTTVESRLALFDAPRARLDASDDPLIVLGRALEPLRDEVERADKRRAGAYARLRPLYMEALLAALGKGSVYPDANSTLRLSFATVKGYAPRDGLLALPQTTVAGMLAKDTGEAPFAVPAKVRAAAGRDPGAWADSTLGGVPVAFLANGDTTGGNSGSPVLNGKGQLVGLNFDRVWENVAGDYGWTPRYSRNVSVDVRFILWMLDRVDGAEHLLEELGVR